MHAATTDDYYAPGLADKRRIRTAALGGGQTTSARAGGRRVANYGAVLNSFRISTLKKGNSVK